MTFKMVRCLHLTQFVLLVEQVLLLICEMFTGFSCKCTDTIVFQKFGLQSMREFQLMKSFKAKHKQTSDKSMGNHLHCV